MSYCQRPGEEPVANTLVVASVHNVQDLAGIQVNDRSRPRLVPSPGLRGRVLEEPHGPIPVLIDTQHPRCQEIHVRKAEHGVTDDLLNQPPGDPERSGCLRHGTTGIDDCL